MFFFFNRGKKRKKHKFKGTRASYKSSNTLGCVQKYMLSASIINKKRLIVYVD